MRRRTEHHWILTLSWAPAPGEVRYATRSGTHIPSRGDTRKDAYEFILEKVCGLTGAPTDTVVTYFSFEPNKL